MIRYDWVWVGDNAYILEEWLVEFIYDNVKTDELEYIAKAFILIKPKNVDEAKEFLRILRNSDFKKVIDAIYERNRC